MKGKFLIILLGLVLFAGAVPTMANSVPIQLGSLIPLGSCAPTTGFTCVGPTSVTTAVAGVGTVTITGFSLWPNTPGNIAVTLDDYNNVPYLGIIGGNNNDEMDVMTGGEVLQIAFSQPVYVTTISLNKLFTAGTRGDFPNEVAGVNFLSSACPNFFCGTNTYVGTANGLLQVNNPFNGIKVDAVQFWAVPTSSSTGSDNSDFGVSALSATPVPEPATLLLFGSGLAAFAARRRLRRKSS